MLNPPMDKFGALKDPMLTLASPAKAYPDWTLPADQAVNFVAGSIVRTELSAGTRLYRVYGGPAGMGGAYWSPDEPDEPSEGAWRSKNAVEPWWNAGTDVAVLTVKDGASIEVWSGGITSQPALYANGDVIPDYFLVGGGRQCFVQSWLPQIGQAVDIVPAGQTPWTSQDDPDFLVPADVRPEGVMDGLDGTDPVHKVALRLYDGAEAMRALAGAMQAAGSPAKAAADNMITLANAIVRNLANDPRAARSIAKRAVGLKRVVEIDSAMLTGANATVARQADATVSGIVASAAIVMHDS